MNLHWRRLLDAVRTGFWFLPIVMLILAAALALLLLHVDEAIDPGAKATVQWAYSGGPEGARSLLSTIAGSMITAASVTFSLASVALSIASQQYGSRVLRNFMQDRVTQVLLGIFVATFIYCVLVVRVIRGTDYSGGFVPSIAISCGIGLSLVSLVMLIYFIHHVSASIQASQIIRVIAQSTGKAIPELYPSEAGERMDEATARETLRNLPSTTLASDTCGYLQQVDTEALMQTACEHNIVVEMLVRPGDHVVQGTGIVRIWSRNDASSNGDATEREIRKAFDWDLQRTPYQDIRFQFQQLADVIIRALSPGINDPFTAINGIDELASGLQTLARRSSVSGARKDRTGHLRLLASPVVASEVLRDTVGHIAIYAAGDAYVMASLRRLLDALSADFSNEAGSQVVADLRQQIALLEEKKAAA